MSVRSFKIAACVPSVLAGALVLRAQGPQQGSPPAAGQAIQLPLSGRSSQNGSVTATETPVPGLTSSVNTLNTSLQVQGNYQGSVPEYAKPLSGALSFREAVARGLSYNLGTVSLTEAVRQAHGQARMVRSALLPNLSAGLREDVQQTNLQALGIRFNAPIPGFSVPTIVGPFNYFDLRATLNQTIVDLTALNNYRSASELVKANQAAMRDSRDLVVYAVGGAYFQTVAALARIRSAEAHVATAQALFNQTKDRRSVGLLAQVDLNRSQVELQTGQQRLTTLQNDFSKLKINLARMIGLPPTDKYEIEADLPNSPPVSISFDQAFRQALDSRADLVSAEAQVRAAERAKSAARFERLPSLALVADYGAIGINPAQSHGTFTVVGSLRIPIWQGGRTEGSIEQADASLRQRQAELGDLKGRIEAEVRQALLDLETTRKQIDVATNNQAVVGQTLELTRQRFDSGITDSVELVQAQESVVSSSLDHIDSVFAYNLAKIALARAMGNTEQNAMQFLHLQ